MTSNFVPRYVRSLTCDLTVGDLRKRLYNVIPQRKCWSGIYVLISMSQLRTVVGGILRECWEATPMRFY